ncbi:MAG: cation:proton antiporter subunit C [Pseudomonadota bacterium]
MLEFVLARYNYWIVIILMMTGLYIVFSRGNLVKTLIGLNLFQTSVFIFYITVGKVVGGTAPILVGDYTGESHGDDHDTGKKHSGETHSDALSSEDAAAAIRGELTNELHADGNDHHGQGTGESLHLAPENAGRNDLFSGTAESQGGAYITRESRAADPHHAEGAAEAMTEVLYSNPLPHVLILTAIVVGVATTAVGLAIAVRIREAYGTVEEDDLDDMDNKAQLAEASF